MIFFCNWGFPNLQPIKMHSTARQRSILIGWKFGSPVLPENLRFSFIGQTIFWLMQNVF